MLPIGVVLNGTSSVLYRIVAEARRSGGSDTRVRYFYTVTIGAGAIGLSIYGMLSDRVGVPCTLAAVAAVVLLVLPLLGALHAVTRSEKPLAC